MTIPFSKFSSVVLYKSFLGLSILSKIYARISNFLTKSCNQSLIVGEGTIIKAFLLRLAYWETINKASIVLPKPASSAKINPFTNGLDKAKQAA